MPITRRPPTTSRPSLLRIWIVVILLIGVAAMASAQQLTVQTPTTAHASTYHIVGKSVSRGHIQVYFEIRQAPSRVWWGDYCVHV